MMRSKRYDIWVLLVLAALMGCQADDWQTSVDEQRDVSVSLAFSVATSSKPQTRMADQILQINDNPYRGMQNIRMVPFALANPSAGVGVSDLPKRFLVNGVASSDYDKSTATIPSWFYYYNRCSFMTGTNAVLLYGRAVVPEKPTSPAALMNYKATYGSLIPSYPDDMVPANITFQLEQMHADATAAPVEAQAIADCLTDIARATGWSTTTDSKLRAFYLNYTGQGNLENHIIPGSKASAIAYVSDLRAKIAGLEESDVRTAILAAIDAMPNDLDDYPSTIGLPDGAAALRWEENAFKPQTMTTTEAAVNSITRYVYPAELYYFDNSRLFMSNVEVSNAVYAMSETMDWNQVLNRYQYKGTVGVSGNTKAVALEKPVQYAVAHLRMTLTEPAVTLKDANGMTVGYSQMAMPLTGVIIGGQHTVGYDFKPQGTQSDVDLRFIYDKQVSGLVTNTLVLESYDDENVMIILEFENNTGDDFTGKNGIIHAGTKFYLIGELDISEMADTEDHTHRVFTQDHTTDVKMQFNATSLASAYNVVPDLMAPRLEIGVKLVADWIQTKPADVPLD